MSIDRKYEQGGWVNSTTSLVLIANTSYSNYATLTSAEGTSFTTSVYITEAVNRDGYFAYILLPTNEVSELAQRRFVGDREDTSRELVDQIATATDPHPWVDLGAVTHNSNDYRLYRVTMGNRG